MAYTVEDKLNDIERKVDSVERKAAAIERGLAALNGRLEEIGSDVDRVDADVKAVYGELSALARDFRGFVRAQARANALSRAQQKIIELRQEIERRFGHYDAVRRSVAGILQAADADAVRIAASGSLAEEFMVTAPDYWLAPCVAALAAWIGDRPGQAGNAAGEALRRDESKASLFFALVCQRAGREGAAVGWVRRYIACQDGERVDGTMVILLDAVGSGLFGADSEGAVFGQMSGLLGRLCGKPDFIERQTERWRDAFSRMRKPWDSGGYVCLPGHSETWPALKDAMEGAALHAEILNRLTEIFEQEESSGPLKARLDGMLDRLVSDYDADELPLRREEELNRLIIELDGDEELAREKMAEKERARGEERDFARMLTDVAMDPESQGAGASARKLAIRLSGEMLTDAYKRVAEQNRANIPGEIEIHVGAFSGKTTDGRNERELIGEFNGSVDGEKADELEKAALTRDQKVCLWAGVPFAGIGAALAAAGGITSALVLSMFSVALLTTGLAMFVVGTAMGCKYAYDRNKAEKNRQQTEKRYEIWRETGIRTIRGALAEVADFRMRFAEKDGECRKVSDFLETVCSERRGAAGIPAAPDSALAAAEAEKASRHAEPGNAFARLLPAWDIEPPRQ